MIVPEHLQKNTGETLDDYHIRLFDKKEEYEIDNYTIANLLNGEAGTDYSESKWRKDYASFKRWEQYFESQKGAVEPEDVNYKETVEISADGSHKSDKLLRMTAKDSKSPEFLLRAHGYDPNEWELMNAKNNIWNSYSKQDGLMTLYSSRISAKPLKVGFDFEKLEELVTKKPKYKITTDKKFNLVGDYLLLPLFDMHWGNNDFDYYEETQHKIFDLLNNKYKEIVLIFGQDMFHNDDFHGRTTKGTVIEKVDMVQAWDDSTRFFVPIIHKALDEGSKVKIVYSKGNHSETVEWAFMQYLKAIFPQCEFNDSLKERKTTLLGKNLIGTTHGDKKNDNRIAENFATEFPIEWSQSTTRTVFTGHRHHERVIDAGGVLVRRMPTKNQIDEYHDDKGYTTAHRRFQVHEFNETEQTTIFYL